MDLLYHNKNSGFFVIKILLFTITSSLPGLRLCINLARPTCNRFQQERGGLAKNSRLDIGLKISSMVVPIVRMVESSPFTQVRG